MVKKFYSIIIMSALASSSSYVTAGIKFSRSEQILSSGSQIARSNNLIKSDELTSFREFLSETNFDGNQEENDETTVNILKQIAQLTTKAYFRANKKISDTERLRSMVESNSNILINEEVSKIKKLSKDMISIIRSQIIIPGISLGRSVAVNLDSEATEVEIEQNLEEACQLVVQFTKYSDFLRKNIKYLEPINLDKIKEELKDQPQEEWEKVLKIVSIKTEKQKKFIDMRNNILEQASKLGISEDTLSFINKFSFSHRRIFDGSDK